ncbi:RNA polymerase sigma-F factor [anaerobic digester metagenome]
MGRCPIMMKFTNEELIRKIREGNEAMKVDLLENNRGMIYKIMGEFGYLLRNEDNKDDLFQAGCLGLMKALNRFDFKFNTLFSTFAYRYIHGEIVRLADAIMHTDSTYTDLFGSQDSDMVAEEIAEFVHRSVSGDFSPDRLENEVVNRETLRKCLKHVTPRQRLVLLYRYYMDMTQADIGKLLGMHQVDVSREEKRAKTRLRLLFGEKHCGIY